MSTEPGVHGECEATAVPSTTLCDALAALGTFLRTGQYAQGVIAQEPTASTADNEPFTPTVR